MTATEVWVLGPMEVVGDGGPVPLRSRDLPLRKRGPDASKKALACSGSRTAQLEEVGWSSDDFDATLAEEVAESVRRDLGAVCMTRRSPRDAKPLRQGAADGRAICAHAGARGRPSETVSRPRRHRRRALGG